MSDDNPLMCCCCRAAHQHIIEEKDAEIERLRLTKEEREAAEWFAEVPKPLLRLTKSNRREQYIAALRGLLDRLGDK